MNCYTEQIREVEKEIPQKQQQLYSHLPPISKIIHIRQTRHVGHSWRGKEELISDFILQTPSLGRASVGRSTRTYLQQINMDTGCSLEDQKQWMIGTNGDRPY